MFLAEPPPSQGDLHFSLLGYPVRIHPLFWLTAWLMGSGREPIIVILWVAAVLLCILLHELSHAVVMRAYGYYPSIVLYVFGGLAIPHPGRYGARRPGPWGDMLIAFAGPASGFILAAILVLGLHYLGRYPLMIFQPSWRDVVPLVIVPNFYLTWFLHDIFYITVMWGLLNLLPIYPLDGGQIAQQVFVLKNPQDAVRQSLLLSVIVGGLMTVITLIQALHEVGQALPLAHGARNLFDIMSVFFLPAMFFFLTYSNFTALQSYRGGWR